jgi:prepilin-type N-terminal cleavage/methylation domain-containing protein
MKTKTLKQNRGFTLIETLVALAIFASSIVALISIAASGVADANFAKNKFIASYLSQEGVEMVRNMRDSNSLAGGNWAAFKTAVSSCYAPNGCTIEPSNLAAAACGTANGCQLNYNSGGFYTYAVAPASAFYRKITVADVGAGSEVAVSSTIYWRQGTIVFNTVYTENLFDWIQ